MQVHHHITLLILFTLQYLTVLPQGISTTAEVADCEIRDYTHSVSSASLFELSSSEYGAIHEIDIKSKFTKVVFYHPPIYEVIYGSMVISNGEEMYENPGMVLQGGKNVIFLQLKVTLGHWQILTSHGYRAILMLGE